MCAAEHTSRNLDPMTNDTARAMATGGRKRLNRAFKAIEYVPRSGYDYFKTFVIFISTHFAFSHSALL
jgi:hypothetical protein